ncbi:MAG: hypothetical protein ABFS39_14950, partial [Pseudomonadota bacterium]
MDRTPTLFPILFAALSISQIMPALADSASTAYQLDPVVVEAEVDEDPALEIPLGMSFEGEELQEVPGSGDDVLRSMQALPGVAVNSDWESGAAIRGSRPENNQYFVDFMPVGYLFHFGGKSVVDGDLVERFDLYPAGYGAQFQDGTGG